MQAEQKFGGEAVFQAQTEDAAVVGQIVEYGGLGVEGEAELARVESAQKGVMPPQGEVVQVRVQARQVGVAGGIVSGAGVGSISRHSRLL